MLKYYRNHDLFVAGVMSIRGRQKTPNVPKAISEFVYIYFPAASQVRLKLCSIVEEQKF